MSYSYQPSGYPDSADLYRIRLLKHTGAVIFWQQQTVICTGTLEQCEAAYRNSQTHNLLAGWWSLVSALIMNWIALFSNVSAIRKLRNLAQQGPAAAVPPVPPAAPAMSGTPAAPATPAMPAMPAMPAVPAMPAAPATPAMPAAPPPGWYGDPSGPGQRYWNGTGWTHWTHPPSHR